MRSKIYFVLMGVITGILPFNILKSIEISDGSKGSSGSWGGGPRAQQSKISIVTIETAANQFTLSCMANYGELLIELTDTSGNVVLSDSMNTDVQNQCSFFAPAGTYNLTVTTPDGLILTGTTVVIP